MWMRYDLFNKGLCYFDMRSVFAPRLHNSPYFCVFKYARAVKQKVWNEAENWGFFSLASHALRARALRALRPRKTLTPRFTDFFTDFEKKTTVLQSNSRLASRDGFLRPRPLKRTGRARIFLSSWLHLRSVITGMSIYDIAFSNGSYGFWMSGKVLKKYVHRCFKPEV